MKQDIKLTETMKTIIREWQAKGHEILSLSKDRTGIRVEVRFANGRHWNFPLSYMATQRDKQVAFDKSMLD